MTIELICLTFITLFTALMWLPYMVNIVNVRGVSEALGYPSNPAAVSQWASRVDRAHRNAVDNLTALLEPMIMAVLGVVIGGLIIAMYLPIFQIGMVV